MKGWHWLLVIVVVVWLLDRQKQAQLGDPIAAALAPHMGVRSTLMPASPFWEARTGDDPFLLTQPPSVPASFTGGAGGIGTGGAGGGGKTGSGGGGGRVSLL